MIAEEIAGLGALGLLEAYRTRTLSPVEVIDALGQRIGTVDPGLAAFNTLCLERAREEAAAAEAAHRRAGSEARPLEGVPIGIKDLFDTAGVRTTYGSPMFSDHVPGTDAEVVRRVRAAGAIVVGKTQTHEFAWGITSVNELMGTSRNPWAPGRVSGGSSGGSAVALAAGLVPLAVGTDTGGSIRIPSSFCGTVGLKPTWGRVSLDGVFPLARTLDHAGPMARDPADAALLFGVLAGEQAVLGADGLRGARVGLCPDLHLVALTPEIETAFRRAADAAAAAGAELVEVALPEAAGAFATYGAVQRYEALRTHTEAGLWPARRTEYGRDVGARLELASTMTPSDYLDGAAARESLRAGFHRALSQVEFLLTPVTAGPPAPIGQDRVTHVGEEIEFRELVMSYTVPQDLVGLPTCTVRAGFDALGVPTAVQLTGPAWSELRVLAAAQALYDATADVQARRPDLASVASPD